MKRFGSLWLAVMAIFGAAFLAGCGKEEPMDPTPPPGGAASSDPGGGGGPTPQAAPEPGSI